MHRKIRGFLLVVLLVTTPVQTAHSQETRPDPSSPECAPDDLACQVLRMPQKPGGGDGMIDGQPPELNIDTYQMDLGVERVPSEQMRLPELKMDAAPIQ